MAFINDYDINHQQYPVITANEVPMDQRVPVHRGYQTSPSSKDVKQAHTHRKGRAGSGRSRRNHNPSGSRSSKGSNERPLQGNTGASSPSSHGSRHGQLVDLVVEDREAEAEDRAQAQREFGSAWAGPDVRRFS